MSDREGASGVPALDDELSLPKATVAKMISGTLSVLCLSTIYGRERIFEVSIELDYDLLVEA